MINEPRTRGDDAGCVRVHISELPLPHTDPLSAYMALASRFGRDEVFLLESATADGRDHRYQITGFGTLLAVSVTRGMVRIDGVAALRAAVTRRLRPLLEETAGELRLPKPRDLWPVLRAVRDTFLAEGSTSGFRFGFMAYFGYDAVRYIEDLPRLIERDPGLPDVQLLLYQGCIVSDRSAKQCTLLMYEAAEWPRLDPGEVAGLLREAGRPVPGPPATVMPAATVTDDISRERYLATVTQGKKYIAVGDIYQVQLGHELTIASQADPLEVYRRLRHRNTSPYMYLTSFAGHTIVGASPELFTRVENDTVTLRPIAGTAPRGGAADEIVARELRTNPKELAEHTMLLDLCRNDIGRICRQDTLQVPEALIVERYSHVLHLVSTVTGHPDPETDSFDIIAAMFPAGTMTGAPKIRAMEIIEEMERSRRGLYAGALGLIDVGGYVSMALCIRTLIYRDGVYRTRASAGIVADSVPAREWDETLAKANAAYWAVTGKELL